MINYSIVMRSVNANLLEINQAKSRINQAKKEGKTPDPKDLELVKTEKQKAFALTGRLICIRIYPGCYPGLGASAPSGRMGFIQVMKGQSHEGSLSFSYPKEYPVISGHGHFRSFSFPYTLPLERNQTGVSVAESLKRSSADGISSSSNHFFNLS